MLPTTIVVWRVIIVSYSWITLSTCSLGSVITLYPHSARSSSTTSFIWGYRTRGQSSPGNRIADEAEKQRDVVEDKLGKVHVSKRAHQDDLFGEVRGAALEGTRHDEHRLQRASPKS